MDSLSGQSEQSSHIVRHTRIIAPETSACSRSVACRIYEWLAPYDKTSYPGKLKLIARYAPGYCITTARHWISGYRAAPLAVLQHWREVLAAQAARIAELDLALADEIARLENRPKRVPHFEAVRRKRLERPREP